MSARLLVDVDDRLAARLEALLARVRELRRNLYPADWDADPLYEVEQELQAVLRELLPGQPGKPGDLKSLREKGVT